MRTPNHARVAALALAAAGAPAAAQDEAFQGVSQAEHAGLVASIGHLGALVDHLRVQLRKAAATMSALHGTASPVDEGRGDLDARIPEHAFRVFVDEHAALLHELAHGLSAAPDDPSAPTARPALASSPSSAPPTEIDAQRYRWLTDEAPDGWAVIDPELSYHGRDIDAAIDRARGEAAPASSTSSAPAESGWVAFADREPPRLPAGDDPSVILSPRVLVTNNIDARDRAGRMSHVWFEHAIKGENEWVAFDSSYRKIWGLTHWFDPFAASASRAAVGTVQPKTGSAQ